MTMDDPAVAAPTPDPPAQPKTIKVKANAAVLGLRAFEVGELPDDDETRACIATGLLEKA
jgi:hypothetical protein